eukprot:5890021-Prymnesium_polylepis.1
MRALHSPSSLAIAAQFLQTRNARCRLGGSREDITQRSVSRSRSAKAPICSAAAGDERVRTILYRQLWRSRDACATTASSTSLHLARHRPQEEEEEEEFFAHALGRR